MLSALSRMSLLPLLLTYPTVLAALLCSFPPVYIVLASYIFLQCLYRHFNGVSESKGDKHMYSICKV